MVVFNINERIPLAQEYNDQNHVNENNRLVDQLFYAHKYDEIVVHNQNCLLNESFILLKRWLKLYTV